jgi:putative hydrolase of HD superfamily
MQKKFSKKFEQLIDFVNFTHEFREVVRVARRPYAKRFENDTEHSYQLAMVSWFLIEQDNLKLDRELCLMYALTHDLVEIYAGDTYAYDNEKILSSKSKREQKALIKIEKRFSKFKTLIKTIKKYENRIDEESRFVYALDKLLPAIQCYLEDGKLLKEKKLSLENVLEDKNKKIIVSLDVDKYWQELVRELKKNKKKLFYNK